MSSGPAPFSDFGKKARDLLTKDYNFGPKFTLTTLSNAGLGITATGVNLNELFLGDIGTQYKIGRTTVHVKVNTKSNVSTTVTLNELVSGLKTSLSFKIPDQKSGKLDVHYLNDHAAVRSSIGLTPTPLLEFSVAVGTKELSIGGEVGFDSASASFTKYNAGIGFNKPDISASLMLADKGKTLKASYIHLVDPVGGHAVAAEVAHRLSTLKNRFTVGSSHRLGPMSVMKTRFSNNGKVAVLYQHEWRPKSLVTLSAEYDPKAVSSPSRVGLALALKLRFEELIPVYEESNLPRPRSQKATVKRKKTKKNKALSSSSGRRKKEQVSKSNSEEEEDEKKRALSLSSGRRKKEQVFQPEPDSNKYVSSRTVETGIV